MGFKGDISRCGDKTACGLVHEGQFELMLANEKTESLNVGDKFAAIALPYYEGIQMVQPTHDWLRKFIWNYFSNGENAQTVFGRIIIIQREIGQNFPNLRLVLLRDQEAPGLVWMGLTTDNKPCEETDMEPDENIGYAFMNVPFDVLPDEIKAALEAGSNPVT